MPRYNLSALGSAEFEKLSQAIVKQVIGVGTTTFGAGKDGAREATYSGEALYPSAAHRWSGEWIFQAKFHDVDLLGIDKSRKQVLADLDAELYKVTKKYEHPCDNYIMITNVPLTPAYRTGNLDRIANEILPKYADKIKNVHIWGADEVSTYLAIYDGIRKNFLDFVVPGDLIAALLRKHESDQTEIERTIKSYLHSIYTHEQYAQLDQAGDVSDTPVKLQNVFFDLAAIAKNYPETVTPTDLRRSKARITTASGIAVNVGHFMLAEDCKELVVVGGPGEGKSTVGQYVAQMHRATLLKVGSEVAIDEQYIPSLPRIPFRVILKDFGQWLAERMATESGNSTLESFICDQIESATSRPITATELHNVLEHNPALLILDGLDEVTDGNLRKNLLERISDFTARCRKVLRADLQVLATTRPTGYSGQFDPSRYFHLHLIKLAPEQVTTYVTRWCEAKNFEEPKRKRIASGIRECLADPQISLLATTPLQVTILALIISSGGTPPRQREALFNEYLEVIYKRETAKGKHIIQSEKELLIGLHKYVGYILQEETTHPSKMRATLDAQNYRRHVTTFLRYNDPYSPAASQKAELRAITTEAGERLVLIVEPVSGEFGFELRSIQEFFAACHLADTSKTTEQRYQRFEAISRLTHWRNVALFFAGRVGRSFPGEAANFLEVLRDVDRSSPDVFLRRGSRLALELASDRAFGPNRRGQRTLLEQGISTLEAHISEHRRREICETLRRLPAEDIRDHVVPILRGKVESLAPVRLMNFLYAAHAVGELELVRQILSTVVPNPALASECLEFGLTLLRGHAENYMSFSDLAAALSDSDLRGVFQGCDWESAVHGLLALKEAGFSDERFNSLCAHIVTSHIGQFYEGTSALTDAYINRLSAISDPAIVSLLCSSVIQRIADYPVRRRGGGRVLHGASTEDIFNTFDLHRLPTWVIRGELSDNAREFEDAALSLHLWILHLWFGEVTEESTLRFCSWYRDACKFSDIWEVAQTKRSGIVSPVMDLLMSMCEAGYDESLLRPETASILEFAGASGAARWAAVTAEGTQTYEAIASSAVRKQGTREYAVQPSQPAVWDALGELVPPQLVEYLVRECTPRAFPIDYHNNRVAAFLQDGMLTSPRLYSLQVLASLESPSSRSKELLPDLLGKLTEEHRYPGDSLPWVLAACMNSEPSFSDVANQALERLGRLSRLDLIGYSSIPILDSASIERLLGLIARRGRLDDSKRGALRMLSNYCTTYSMRRQTSNFKQSRPRFGGFASVHRSLMKSSYQEIRIVGLELFSLRPPTSRIDFELIFDYISSSKDISAIHALAQLAESLPQTDTSLERWLSMLQRLLESGSLTIESLATVAVAFERLSNLSSQSLELRQVDLALPLASPDV